MNPKKIPVILVADDDSEDQLLIRRVLERFNLDRIFRFVSDGEELMDYLHHRGKFEPPEPAPRPDLILLDLKMPKKDGIETLSEIKTDQTLHDIPVVVLTTSSSEHDIQNSYAAGANSYITKPARFEDWIKGINTIKSYWFGLVSLPPVVGTNGHRRDPIPGS